MADWARRFGVVRRRRTAGLVAAALVGIVMIGLIAPASQAGQPAIAFTPSSWSPGPIAVGSSTSQVFTLNNTGRSATAALTVALSGSSAFTITNNGCPSPTSLPKGGSCSLTIAYRPTAPGATDHATLTALGQKSVAVATATLTGTSVPEADLAITKSESPSPVVPGDATAYTITVSNLGPNDVTGASVADTMPAAITSDTFTASQTGGASGFTTGTGTGNISDAVNMPAGSTITYAVNAEISSAATGTLPNTATVSAPAGVVDPNLANNSATVAPTLVPMADLSVTKTQAPTSVNPGGQTVYTITVTNNGPSDAPGVSVTDTMPSAITGDTFTASQTGGASGFTTGTGSGNIGDTVTMPAGSAVTYTVTATVSSTPTPTLSFSNTATATAPAGVTDPNTANNSATASGIIGVAENCATTCGPLTTGSTNTGSTTTTGSGTGGSSGTLQEALFSGSLGCTYQTGDLHMDAHISEVLLSSGVFSKTVSLEYPAVAGAPTIDPTDTTNGPDSDRDFDDVVWNSQVCFQAAPSVTFKTRSGSLANVGLLPNCPSPLSSATGPCVDRAHSALINIGAAGTINYDVVLVVFIPAGAAGDPRMN